MFMNFPYGVGILTGISPRLLKVPSPKRKAVMDGFVLNEMPERSQYALAWFNPTTDLCAPVSIQIPLNDEKFPEFIRLVFTEWISTKSVYTSEYRSM
jgi:hypothetical protein